MGTPESQTINTSDMPEHIRKLLDWYAENHTLDIPVPLAEELLKTFYKTIGYTPTENSPFNPNVHTQNRKVFKTALYTKIPEKWYTNYGYEQLEPFEFRTEPYHPQSKAAQTYNTLLANTLPPFATHLASYFPDHNIPPHLNKALKEEEQLKTEINQLVLDRQKNLEEANKDHRFYKIIVASSFLPLTILTPLAYMDASNITSYLYTAAGVATISTVTLLKTKHRKTTRQRKLNQAEFLQYSQNDYYGDLLKIDHLLTLHKLNTQYTS